MGTCRVGDLKYESMRIGNILFLQMFAVRMSEDSLSARCMTVCTMWEQG